MGAQLEATIGGRRATFRALVSLPWRPVLLSFAVSRLVVVVALAVARALSDSPNRSEGLLGWDAHWYQLIAQHGYQRIPAEGIRFFPLLPLAARALAAPLGPGPGIWLLI